MFLLFPFPGFRSPLLILIFPCALAAGVYRERLRKRYTADVSEFAFLLRYGPVSATDFDTGLFACLDSDGSVKLSAFNLVCCPVRLAVNASATACNDFWFTLIMGVFALPFLPIIGYILRMHIRHMYDMEPHPVADFFAWLCCYCCALTQESKFIDREFQAIRGGASHQIGRVVF